MRFGVVPFAAPVTGVPPPLALRLASPSALGLASSISIAAVPSLGVNGGVRSRGDFSIALFSARRVALRSAFSFERDLSFLMTQTIRIVYRSVLSLFSPLPSVVRGEL